jgi:hypothetical protein
VREGGVGWGGGEVSKVMNLNKTREEKRIPGKLAGENNIKTEFFSS